MNLRRLPRLPLTPMGWAALAGGLLIVAIAVFAVLSWSADRRGLGEARVGQAQSQARTRSAGEATEIIARGADRDAATDEITRRNEDAIAHAPGAGQRLDPGLNRAGRLGLCQYAAYRDSPECVQLAPPAKP